MAVGRRRVPVDRAATPDRRPWSATDDLATDCDQKPAGRAEEGSTKRHVHAATRVRGLSVGNVLSARSRPTIGSLSRLEGGLDIALGPRRLRNHQT